MALIIAVSNLKGGVGKSTISLNVASCLHAAGHKVLIVDSDPQGTCAAWASKAAEAGNDEPPVVSMTGATIRRDLPKVATGFDVVVIDSPPRMGVEARAAMLSADLVLVPITPGAADVWAAAETVAVLDDARSMRPELKAVAVLNRADRTTLTKMAGKAIASLGIELLGTSLGQRVAYGEATLAGKGAANYAPSSESAREVRRLVKTLLGQFENEEVAA